MEAVHWIVEVVRHAGLLRDEPSAIDVGTPPAEAWASVCRACAVTDVELARHIAAHFRIAVADFGAVEDTALRLVPETLARRALVFPLREDDRQLIVATANPTDLDAEQALGFAAGRTPQFAVATPAAIKEAIESRYSPDRIVEGLLGGVDLAPAAAVSVLDTTGESPVDAEQVETEPVIQLTSLILRDAVAQQASDIHLEPSRGGAAVRFRVDGVLRKYMQMPLPALTRVVSRIKVIGKLDIADRLRPQDGRARVRVNGGVHDLRISTVPTREAEKAVIRVLYSDGTSSLEDIGLPGPALERFRRALSHRDGIVVVTGPTGSGKTTTLYAALQELATDEVNVMTVEDPVEYELPGITQIQVEPRQGVTFASALRSILRQDPDVIFVGEIRDLETAQIAVQASLTGHLVLATLHTNDAIGVVQRLVDLGLDRPSIASSLRGVLAQRLLRRVCRDCGVSPDGALPPDEEALAARWGARPGRIGRGCGTCDHGGYRGRLPVVEVALVDHRLTAVIHSGGSAAALEVAATAGGMASLRDAAIERVRAGDTTLRELERVLGDPGEPAAATAAAVPHVLIVDDDAVNRTLARTLLDKAGYRVSEAEDGDVALGVLHDGDYDLIVLDLDMPRMGGREVLEQIRKDRRTAGLPVVVLTGTHDPSAEVRLLENGADDYIRKPIDPPRFLSRIKAALRRAGAQ